LSGFEDNDYRKKSCIMVETSQATISGRKRGERRVRIAPTSHYGRPYSRIEDYELKVNITSAIRRAIWRRLHGMVGLCVFLKFRDQASDFVTNCGLHAFEPLSPRKAHRGGTVRHCLSIKGHDHVDRMGEADTSPCFLSRGSSRLLR